MEWFNWTGCWMGAVAGMLVVICWHVIKIRITTDNLSYLDSSVLNLLKYVSNIDYEVRLMNRTLNVADIEHKIDKLDLHWDVLSDRMNDISGKNTYNSDLFQQIFEQNMEIREKIDDLQLFIMGISKKQDYPQMQLTRKKPGPKPRVKND